MKCNCKYCQNIDYDNSEYFVDLSLLANVRPIGVSGLLRVKNEAEFLSLCIDSCIDALDELIIVYQASEDDSLRIIEQKRMQYPDKIRTFFYRPLILSHNLTDEEFSYASALENTSIHLLANYYNYTLSKASYRYAVKIDGDQIYFTDKLKVFCDAFRSEGKKKISIREYWAVAYIYSFVNLTNIFPKLLSPRFRFLIPSKMLVDKYKCYTLKVITNKKYPVSFSGINLYTEFNKWMLPLGCYAQGVFPPFNGIHDHDLFKISSETFYLPQPISSDNTKYSNCIIESFNLVDRKLSFGKGIYKFQLMYGGFLWYHTAPLKMNTFLSQKENHNFCKLPLFNNRIDFFDLELRLPVPLRHWMRLWYYLFWEKEQSELPKSNLSEINRILQSYLINDSVNEKE